MERKGVRTLSIHGFPWAIRYLIILKIACVFVCFENFLSVAIHFMVTLVSVLKSVIKHFENFCLKSMFESVV